MGGRHHAGAALYTVVTGRSALFSIDATIEKPTGDDLHLVSLANSAGDRVTLARPDGVTAIPGSDTDLLMENGSVGGDRGRVLRARLKRR